jgi:hypothetical protein
MRIRLHVQRQRLARRQNVANRCAPRIRQKDHAAVMRTHVWRSRPQRVAPAHQLSPPVLAARPVIGRELPTPTRQVPAPVVPSSTWTGFQPDPHVDYGRFLTPEGGILFIYKDHDVRLRHTLWRLFAWTVSSGTEGWYLFHYSPVESVWLNLACLLAIGVVNWLIVRKPVELYRRVEIRPDCMILESAEIFWLRYMENGWPAFQRDEKDNQLLCGIYGTRFVEYLTVRRFDKLDRMAEVFVAHLQDAMTQLWAAPQEYQ